MTTTTTKKEMSESEYRSSISVRPTFNRTLHSQSTATYGSTISSGTSRTLKITEIGGSTLTSGMSPFGGHAASAIRESRTREKKEMSELNDRLASYIEKVRFLEAQNRKMEKDLDLLRGKWGHDSTSVKVMFETELRTAKELIADSDKERAQLEDQIRKLTEELNNYRNKMHEAERGADVTRKELDNVLGKLGALEAEIELLKRRISLMEDTIAYLKRENHKMMDNLHHSRNAVEQETLNRIDYQNQVQTLLEECDFIKRIHDSEIHDLLAMASRDTTVENREYFKNELSSAIRDIRSEYDHVNNTHRTDIESWYKLKVQEIHTQASRNSLEQNYAREEVKRLRTTLGDMRGKMADLEGRNLLLEKQVEDLNYQMEEDMRTYEQSLNDKDSSINKLRDESKILMVELQMLIDTKQTLDAEIVIYRKMLDGEENRAGLRQLVEQVVKTTSIHQTKEIEIHCSQYETITFDEVPHTHYLVGDKIRRKPYESLRVLKGETTSHSSYSRSAKGNVSIQEVEPTGKFIILENIARRDENIGDWKLRRKIAGKREIVYTFPREFVLRAQKNVKIFARGQGIHSPPDSLVFDLEDSFGTGNDVVTTLYNKEGEERASHSQRASHN
ncbi:hypothetical protein L3Y34_011909 [Caenorhabditis briggsae]|uniref:Uncharacterized protein n=1 Tax=Caenorhabditis briggsae TaxID=6238 RepID=A0AAE8ZVN5_CAEBR|nr:hypothetical protein L3Y34_011909 [Caenorhabditis briggsae]